MSGRARRFTVHRLNTDTGKELTVPGLTEREARARVFWCGTDNLDLSRKDAAADADHAPIDGTPFTVGPYEFTITRE